jgi:phosphate:Na+ symporter
MFTENSEKKFFKIYDKIEKYEGISDRMEVEIANYLTKISQGDLSDLGSKRIKAQLTVVSELESVADCCYNLAKTIRRKRDNKVVLNQKLTDNVKKMMGMVKDSIVEMQKNLDHGYTKINIVQAIEMEQSINNYRDRLKKEHLKDIEKQEYDYKTGVIYSDLFSECEKCADYVINVSEAIEGINKN